MAKANIYCFHDVILLFKSEQGGGGSKMIKFGRTYFLNGPHVELTPRMLKDPYYISDTFLLQQLFIMTFVVMTSIHQQSMKTVSFF